MKEYFLITFVVGIDSYVKLCPGSVLPLFKDPDLSWEPQEAPETEAIPYQVLRDAEKMGATFEENVMRLNRHSIANSRALQLPGLEFGSIVEALDYVKARRGKIVGDHIGWDDC